MGKKPARCCEILINEDKVRNSINLNLILLNIDVGV